MSFEENNLKKRKVGPTQHSNNPPFQTPVQGDPTNAEGVRMKDCNRQSAHHFEEAQQDTAGFLSENSERGWSVRRMVSLLSLLNELIKLINKFWVINLR
jgi:hypothetical protein